MALILGYLCLAGIFAFLSYIAGLAVGVERGKKLAKRPET